jgi:hypothetical protein
MAFRTLVISLLVLGSRGELTAESEFSVKIDADSPTSDFAAPNRIFGFHEIFPTGQTEMVWQSPERVGFGRSVAVLLMAHGCSHAATDFFDQSKDCKDCIGLPVERRLVHAALQRGFFVVAVSSNDRVGSKYGIISSLRTIHCLILPDRECLILNV